MKATDLLKQHHREVEQLFMRIEKSQGEERDMLVRELASKLAAHMRIEEESVYPLARELDDELVNEALEEHTIAAFELKRLADVGIDDDSAEAKLKVLKELIKHHVAEEEREMFPKMERAMPREQLEQLGQDLEMRFDELVESGYGADLFGRKRDGGKKRRRPMEARAMR